MSNMSLGLSCLMEAMKQADNAVDESAALYEAFEDTVDDDVKVMVAGNDMASLPDEEDDLDADMAGLGIDDEDEDKYKKLLAMIPEDGDDAEENLDSITESLMMEATEIGLIS